MPTLRVMTYNILHGGAGREELIRETVCGINPDVAIFTEVTEGDSFEAIAGAVGAHRVVGASPFSRARGAIVSRWPIVESRQYGPPWAPRKWIEATMRPFEGSLVRIHGLHLMPHALWPFELWRAWEVRVLLQHLDARGGVPQIVAGDFNAVMVGELPRRSGAPMWVQAQWWLQGGMIPRWALKPLIDAGYTDCYRTCNAHADGFTVASWNPSARIDYVFASSELQRSLRSSHTLKANEEGAVAQTEPRRSLAELFGWTATRSLGGRPSDHLPVWADFEWPSEVEVDSSIPVQLRACKP